MSKIKGQNFRFFANIDSGGLAAVPEETNVSVSLTGNTEDTTTKDTEGLFQQEDIVSTAWSAQVDSYQAEPAQLRAVLRTFKAAQSVPVKWDQTAGTQNRQASNANFKRSGNALLNDFTMQFDDRAIANCSLQFQGTGALSAS